MVRAQIRRDRGPAAPAMRSEVTSGAPCWTTASTGRTGVGLRTQLLDGDPVCIATTAPNGIATNADGRIVTEAMNQDCR